MTIHKVLHLRDDIGMCQEKEEEDTLLFKNLF